MRIGSAEHYGWTDWYAVSVRHVFSAADTGGSSYAWVEGPRGPRGDMVEQVVRRDRHSSEMSSVRLSRKAAPLRHACRMRQMA